MTSKRHRVDTDIDVETKETTGETAQKIINEIRCNYTCPICCDLLCCPISLTCGHNFCSHCVRQWYIANKEKKLKCPMCRRGSHLQEELHINRTIDKTIESLYPTEYERVLRDLEKELQVVKQMERFNKSEDYNIIASYIHETMSSAMEEQIIYSFNQIYIDMCDKLTEYYENRLKSENQSYSRDDPWCYLKLYYVWRREEAGTKGTFFYGPYMDPGSNVDLVDPRDVDDLTLEVVDMIHLLGQHPERSFSNIRRRLRESVKFPVDLSEIPNFNIWGSPMEQILRTIITHGEQ
jgi:hypothetical protein